MTGNIRVKKYDGTDEPLDIDKIYKVLGYAAEGLDGISVSQIMMNINIQMYDGITTDEIQKNLIEATHNLVSLENPDYETMAARLVAFQQRKQAYQKFAPPSFDIFVNDMVKRGLYDPSVLTYYNDAELRSIGKRIKHERDLEFKYAGIKQLQEKCLIKDKDGNVLETPQFMYMMIPLCLFMGIKEREKRFNTIIGYYEVTSSGALSHPTPVNAGVRTRVKQYSSCVLFDVACDLDSQLYAYYSIGKYTSQRAGVGLNIGRIRAYGDKFQGSNTHPGPFSFTRVIESIIKNTTQGPRGGAATAYFPFWHKDVEDLLSLKNNRGRESNRIRHLDYNVQLSRLFYRRYVTGQQVSLFSPKDVPDLYEAFFRNEDEFEALYTRYEKDPSISRKTLPAKALMDKIVIERSQTGRIYIFNADHVNSHSSFNTELAPVYMSNLCVEITLPTKPLVGFSDLKNSEIALCTLSAVNMGLFDKPEDMEAPLTYAVRGLDELLDYQDYPLQQTAEWAKKRRSLGIGVVGYAHFLAKRGLKFGSDEGLRETHRYFEAFQYYLIKASVELAKEKGPCELFHETKYAQGILPIDTYCRKLDEICDEPLHYDWEALRKDVLKYGMRHSTLSSLMPSETSSQVVKSTDGVNPPKSALIIKGAKDSSKRQIVPDYKNLGHLYDYKFNDVDNKRFIRANAVMQKFIDQSISTNTFYNPLLYPNQKVPTDIIIDDILYAYSLGIKTLYYQYTKVDDSLLKKRMDASRHVELPEEDTQKELSRIEGSFEEACDSCTI